MSRRSVIVLGSTGSIGVSTLDLLSHCPDEVDLRVLTAGRNVAKLAEQALAHRPALSIIDDEALLPELRERLAGSGLECAAGRQAIIDAAGQGADWVMSSIVGAAGLAPTLAAAKTGSTIALANKESLVCAGPALLGIIRKSGGKLIPVDSEHSAIFQVFEPGSHAQIRRLILTASGGPFRTWSHAAMRSATPAQAVAHPNWSMGAKISVDSASMMNKGLEMIEAAFLFGMTPDRIDVIVHPQSIVHSLVEYEDGSTLAQMGPPDMRTPIAFAWTWPGRMAWPAPRLDLAALGKLTFEAPDEARFPALRIARQALVAGGPAPAAMNAANEVAVAAFLAGDIGFCDIPAIVEATMESVNRDADLAGGEDADAVEWAMAVDRSARVVAASVLTRFGRT